MGWLLGAGIVLLALGGFVRWIATDRPTDAHTLYDDYPFRKRR